MQISIRRDVYEKLKRSKRDGESFSDTIDRVLSSQSNAKDIIDCYGILRDNNDVEILDAYTEGRKKIRDAMRSRFAHDRDEV
jgi:predicted CopG family antitoxin